MPRNPKSLVVLGVFALSLFLPSCITKVSKKKDALPKKISTDRAPVCLEWAGRSFLESVGKSISQSFLEKEGIGKLIALALNTGQARGGHVAVSGEKLVFEVEGSNLRFCGPQALAIEAVRISSVYGVTGLWQFYDFRGGSKSGIAYAAQVRTGLQGKVTDGCGLVQTDVSRAGFFHKRSFVWTGKVCAPPDQR